MPSRGRARFLFHQEAQQVPSAVVLSGLDAGGSLGKQIGGIAHKCYSAGPFEQITNAWTDINNVKVQVGPGRTTLCGFITGEGMGLLSSIFPAEHSR